MTDSRDYAHLMTLNKCVVCGTIENWTQIGSDVYCSPTCLRARIATLTDSLAWALNLPAAR